MASKEIQLPELGEGVTEGELVKWLVKPGDQVDADQPVAEMMTDKATVEVPSPIAGSVVSLNSKEGDVVEVGQVMLVLEVAGATSTAKSENKKVMESKVEAPGGKAQPAKETPSPVAVPISAAQAGVTPPPADERVLATPSTRRLARETGVDINQVSGTGLAGRVTRDDVLKVNEGHAPGAPVAALRVPSGSIEERVPLRGVRKKIAENMQMSKRIIPHFTLMDEANVTSLVGLREELKATAEKRGIKITYLPFVMKALIATLREFPMLNASIDDENHEIVYKKYYNIGFAADTPTGLVVPVIKNADSKTIQELSQEISVLAKKARDGKLALDEMKGATITITNIGSVGGTYATPIINHPEVAILGMYKISEKPVIKHTDQGMELDIMKVMNFTITADHRLIDGAVAANFLRSFMNRIENPGVLMLDMN